MKRISRPLIDVGRSCRLAILLSLLAGSILPSRAILYDDYMQYGGYSGLNASMALAASPSFSAVGLVTTTQNENGQLKNYNGTGTLIVDPNTGTQWVLTAAHNWDWRVTNISFAVGGATYNSMAGTFSQHPNWKASPNVGPNQGWDVGLFRLSDIVPNVTPALLYTSGDELGKVGYTVGFGNIGTGTSAAVYNNTIKLAMANQIDRVSTQQGRIISTFYRPGGILSIDFDNGTSNCNILADPGFPTLGGLPQTWVIGGTIDGSTSSSVQVNMSGNVLEGGTAKGDSGGPTFIYDTTANSYKIAGITSGGFNPLYNDVDNGLYGSLSYMTRVSKVSSWINMIMSQSGAPMVAYTSSGNQMDINNYAGAGYIRQSGSGNVTLSGNSTYTGGTIISNGKLEVANNSALGTASVTISGGGLVIDAGVDIQNAITITGTTGNVTHIVRAGDDLANTINVSSSLEGGRDTAAAILSGTASQAGNILAEFNFVANANNDDCRISDVFTLSGVPMLLDGSAKDTFALELFADTPLDASCFIAWLDPNSNAWVNAVAGNIGGTRNFVLGAWDASYGLGSYGVDIDNEVVWAVLNHNSDFAVVPEPTAAVLMMLSGAGMFVWKRRRVAPFDKFIRSVLAGELLLSLFSSPLPPSQRQLSNEKSKERGESHETEL